MKFGKEFRTHLEETLPEWRDKFLCYKPLKKLLKHFPDDSLFADPKLRTGPHIFAEAADNATGDAAVCGGDRGCGHRGQSGPAVELQEWFVRILNEELEKFNDFYVDKEEDFIIRLQELKVRIEQLKEKSSKEGVFRSENEFGEGIMEIRKDFVTIHGEMVLLKNYSSLNFAGLLKILKKYDKRTGRLLRLPFTQLALHQPFFTTEPLTRLVRECEENLELLFPLEAEVIESTSALKDQSKQPPHETTITSFEIAEETLDVHRGTLAAMRAIQGLQKASSSYNPLSFRALLDEARDGDYDGSVTAENSPATRDICNDEDKDEFGSK